MIVILFIITSLLTLIYVALMLAYRLGWSRQDEFVLPEKFTPSTFISVLIPARNERNNIGACIRSIVAQKYPAHLFEVIVIDDHSEDGTADIVRTFDRGVQCISLADHIDGDKKINAYKKAALAAGITHSRGVLIVTTDADCIAQPDWLLHIAAIYEHQQPLVTVAPVTYTCNGSILQIFQLVDFMSMQGITAATHYLKLGNMSNGANFAFSREAYGQVQGYEGTEHLASGDDYLLMMKINKAMPGSTAFLKSQNAIVTTAPQPGWRSFLQQRIRWASKSGKYPDYRITAILLFVYVFNFFFLVLFVAGFFNALYFRCLLAMLLIKICAELWFLAPVARFFNKRWVLKYMPALQPLHIGYIIIAGFLGFAGGYEWKGRKVR